MPLSRPLLSTVWLIRSGFSSTALCVSEEPMVVTMPSPTRAIMVSSPAPPTRRFTSVRTVTRALARSSIPSLATAEMGGVSMTLGITLICTACSTSRPARSMAQASAKVMGMLACWAEIMALATRSMLPPASRCFSSWSRVISRPALRTMISESTRRWGEMRRRRIPISADTLTFTPEDIARTHSPSGT